MEIGIQLHLPTYRALTMPQLVDLGRVAEAGGVGQIWVTDNLQSRNAFVVLAALASSVPVKLGTAVTVQYFRNPVDVADAAAAITEMMDGRELAIGLGRGNSRTPNLVASPAAGADAAGDGAVPQCSVCGRAGDIRQVPESGVAVQHDAGAQVPDEL